MAVSEVQRDRHAPPRELGSGSRLRAVQDLVPQSDLRPSGLRGRRIAGSDCGGTTRQAYDRGMGSAGLERARDKMVAAGMDQVAIETFAHYFRLLEHGETGMIPESSIEPVDSEALARRRGRATRRRRRDAHDRRDQAQRRPRHLDGHGPREVAALRAQRPVLPRHHRPAGAPPPQGVRRPAAAAVHEQLPHLGRHHGRPGALRGPPGRRGCRWSSCRTRSPSSCAKDLAPVSWPRDPDLEWCPPGHGDLYTALRGTGLLERLLDAGLRAGLRLELRQPRRRTRRPGRRLVRRPVARRSRSRRSAVPRRDRKGGHFARRKSDGRIVLRETAQTLPEDQDALADLERHRFCSTNNLWFDLRAMKRGPRRPRRHPRSAADPQREDRRPGRPDHARR